MSATPVSRHVQCGVSRPARPTVSPAKEEAEASMRRTREQGCIDLARNITMTLGEMTVVNNDDETMRRTTSAMTFPSQDHQLIFDTDG